MADQQPGNGSAEPLSYDADMLADVRGAFDEVSTETPATETETPAAAPADRQPTTPGEPKAEHPTDPTRYADGKFKPTKEDVAQQGANEQHAKAAREQQPQLPLAQPPQPEALNLSVPPSSWPVAAKAEWDKLPEVVRAANVQREIDISNGQAKYETTKELIPFVELAHSQGQSPREVIERYIGAEQHLRQDFLGGMVSIGSGMGYTPQQIAYAMAQRYLGQSNGQTPEGYQQPSDPQQGGQTPGYDPAYLQQYINPLEQRLSRTEAYLQQQRQAEQNRQESAVKSVLARVASDPSYRYFANVEEGVVHALQLMNATGRRTGDDAADLQTAYRSACLNHPEVSQLFVKEQLAKEQAVTAQQQKEAAEKARHASRSITGSPSTGPARDYGDDGDSPHDDARRAYRAHMG